MEQPVCAENMTFTLGIHTSFWINKMYTNFNLNIGALKIHIICNSQNY